MKNILTIKILIICVIVSAVLFSCKKDGAAGPEGKQGVAGPSGSTILSGNGLPSANLGMVGDFYLDLSSSNFYGPKKANDWGNPFVMKGNTGATGNNGAAGEPGSKILSGNGIPAVSIGVSGDYYLDKDTYMLYGPKMATGWGTSLSLKGPAGNANVLYSGWNFAKNIGDTVIDGSNLKKGHLLAPALTNALVSEALVQVYCDFGGGTFPLPYISFAGGKQNTISYIVRPNRFIITRFTADNSNSINLSSAISYRYVIIPGGTKLALANKVDINDYEAVKRFFKLEN